MVENVGCSSLQHSQSGDGHTGVCGPSPADNDQISVGPCMARDAMGGEGRCTGRCTPRGSAKIRAPQGEGQKYIPNGTKSMATNKNGIEVTHETRGKVAFGACSTQKANENKIENATENHEKSQENINLDKGRTIEHFKISLLEPSERGCKNRISKEETNGENCKNVSTSLQIPYKIDQNKIESQKSDKNEYDKQNANQSSQDHLLSEARKVETSKIGFKTDEIPLKQSMTNPMSKCYDEILGDIYMGDDKSGIEKPLNEQKRKKKS